MAADRLVGPRDISTDMLESLYTTAGMRTTIDQDGDLAVSSGVTCYVSPTASGDRIQLAAFLSTADDAPRHGLLEFANRVNNQISSVRARVLEQDRLMFDYHIPVDGGTTRRAIVLATQFFLDAAVAAVSRCDSDGVVV